MDKALPQTEIKKRRNSKMYHSYLASFKTLVFSATVILSTIPAAQAKTLPAATCVRDVTRVMDSITLPLYDDERAYSKLLAKQICGNLDIFWFKSKKHEAQFRTCVRSKRESEDIQATKKHPKFVDGIDSADNLLIYDCAKAAGKSEDRAVEMAYDLPIAAWNNWSKTHKEREQDSGSNSCYCGGYGYGSGASFETDPQASEDLLVQAVISNTATSRPLGEVEVQKACYCGGFGYGYGSGASFQATPELGQPDGRGAKDSVRPATSEPVESPADATDHSVAL